MLFAYALEDHPQFAGQVRRCLLRCQERGDTLLTSCLAVAEVMAGSRSAPHSTQASSAIRAMGFHLLPFDERCMPAFARLRSETRLRAPDAIHLACAAAAGTDMFLTGDR